MVGMLSVFVSSLQRDYSAVRGAVRRAVEILHMRPLMAELVGARPESPQRALLDLMAEADVFLLVIGARYSGPTEDEFNEARRLGRPIVVLKQRVDLAEEQQAFLERAAAGWAGECGLSSMMSTTSSRSLSRPCRTSGKIGASPSSASRRRSVRPCSLSGSAATALVVVGRRHGLRWCRLSRPLSSMRSVSSMSWATP